MAITVIHQPNEKSFSRNTIYASFLSTGYGNLENYSVEVVLVVEKTFGQLDFETIVTLRDKPDAAGVTKFPLHEILHSELNERVTVNIPSPTNAASYILDNQRRYQIVYYERFGNPSAPASIMTTFPKSVIFGAVDQAEAANWFDNRDATTSLWSGQPDRRRVKKDLPQYLHWYNYTGADTNLKLEITAFDSAGTSTLITKTLSTTIIEGQTIVIPVGYNQLAIDDILTDAAKYTVQILDSSDTPVAPVRSWYVDCWNRECREKMLWLNTFNAPETIELTGRTRKSINIQRLVSERIATTNYSPIVPDRFQWKENARENYTFRTGYHSEEQIEALQEMLVINRVYRLRNNSYAPLLLTDTRYKIKECFEFLHTLEFNADIAKSTRAYTVFPEVEEECCCDDALVFSALGAITFADGTAIAFDEGTLIG